MDLEELRVYKLSMEIGEKVWHEVKDWHWFDKSTIGRQLIRSVDSIAANISEGYGRYHYKDSRKFVYYSRGSLYETKTWLTKAQSRQLITEEKYNVLKKELNDLGVQLNNYIKSIGKQG